MLDDLYASHVRPVREKKCWYGEVSRRSIPLLIRTDLAASTTSLMRLSIVARRMATSSAPCWMRSASCSPCSRCWAVAWPRRSPTWATSPDNCSICGCSWRIKEMEKRRRRGQDGNKTQRKECLLQQLGQRGIRRGEQCLS